MKLTTDRHEALHGLFATAELLVYLSFNDQFHFSLFKLQIALYFTSTEHSFYTNHQNPEGSEDKQNDESWCSLTLFLPHLQRPISINANSRRALQLKQRLLFFCVGRDGELSRLVLELPPAVGVLQSPASSCLTTYTPHNLEISPTGITVYILP